MIEGVTIEQLRTLRAVAEAGSFTAAARKLGRVQAAVSQSIDRLEAELGLRLFDRSGRTPRLTKNGEAVVEAAVRIEDRIDALEELVASLKQGAETSLSVVVDALFPTVSLVAFAQDFAREHPTVELVVVTDVLSSVTARVREKRSAWGIAIEDADRTDLDHRPIAEVRLVPVAAKEHALAQHQGSIDSPMLAEMVQIVLAEHHQEAATSPDHGVFSERSWRVVDLATKRALILGGLGWGHMPEHLVREDLRDGRLVELSLDAWGDTALSRALLLVWRRASVMGPVAKWAQEHLVELCQREIGSSPKVMGPIT